MEQRLWRMDTTVAIGGTLCGLLLSFTFLFLSDRLWDTPVWLRTLSSLAALGAAGAWALRTNGEASAPAMITALRRSGASNILEQVMRKSLDSKPRS